MVRARRRWNGLERERDEPRHRLLLRAVMAEDCRQEWHLDCRRGRRRPLGMTAALLESKPRREEDPVTGRLGYVKSRRGVRLQWLGYTKKATRFWVTSTMAIRGKLEIDGIVWLDLDGEQLSGSGTSLGIASEWRTCRRSSRRWSQRQRRSVVRRGLTEMKQHEGNEAVASLEIKKPIYFSL